jgi:hypothetical protein
MQKRRNLTMQDYFDFLTRAKWKLYEQERRLERVDLRVIDEGNNLTYQKALWKWNNGTGGNIT